MRPYTKQKMPKIDNIFFWKSGAINDSGPKIAE